METLSAIFLIIVIWFNNGAQPKLINLGLQPSMEICVEEGARFASLSDTIQDPTVNAVMWDCGNFTATALHQEVQN